ncbi:hypothetical protein CathTA2_1403 [Caldalkalibacillus thermarum TA2.A1]|uniref:Uncharacterized protein n=1 Tax=Caldalkalibacillus thermarum (strain TA2.A1) TaxID=986075 RepID=F5L6F3_CALTT|nr:hypothetical protein [Caldalkalibacillus thermarum]EGL83063.1 hypothetical protein CathTA2_1403 [Caldalkalibacillus thermarum TA2.A1]QZT34900.1 hypothetical protein HUR95_06530 [Caldalkalibacillus thermarum TA2.A1]GGK16649.1 hypothetical protein GCM10010965_07140 [Caldalkalibacillus thermarum]GGK26426.1 hypothetical protein GCM10010965_18920 [Caldalkalibacillus thermarum]
MSFWQRMADINLLVWISAVFIFHGLLYLLLGTPNWMSVTLMATSVWALGLLIIRAVGRALIRQKT